MEENYINLIKTYSYTRIWFQVQFTIVMNLNRLLYSFSIDSCNEIHQTLVTMPSPNEKLASALRTLKALQDQGHQAIQGTELSRSDREALQRAGFLKPVIRGWYIPAL